MKFLPVLSTVLVLSFALVTTAAPSSIKDIKGTWHVIEPEHRLALSPACGALDSEMRYTEKLYYFGNPEHATVQLVKAIFMPVGGAFHPSQLNQPVVLFSVRTIGKLLGAIQLNQGGDEVMLKKAIVNAVACDNDFKQALRMKHKNRLDLSYQDYDDLKNKLEVCEKIQKENHYVHLKADANGYFMSKGIFKHGEKDDNKLIETLKEYREKFLSEQPEPFDFEKTIAVLQAKASGPKVKKTIEALSHVSRFADLIIRSLAECRSAESSSSSSSSSLPAMPITNSQHYEQYATQHVLLTWLYRKAQNKRDFIPYFESLPQQFLVSGYVADGEDVYQGNDYKDIEQDIASKLNEQDGSNIFNYLKDNADLAAVIYAGIMNQKYGQDIPYLSEHATNYYDGMAVATCVENAIRNLCNIFTYNKKERIFVSNSLSLNLPLNLRAFYGRVSEDATNNLEDDVNKLQVHQDWSDIVQNLPYIAYGKIKLPGSPKALDSKEVDKKIGGFIKLSGVTIPEGAERSSATIKLDGADHTFQTITINKNTLVLVNSDDDSLVFEIMPSMQNVIVMVDNLLGLGLFSSGASSSSSFYAPGLSDIFFNADFNATYFPEICKRCGWEIEGDFDASKLNDQAVDQSISLKKGEALFTVNVQPFKHAYVERVVNEEAQEEYRKELSDYFETTLADVLDPMHLLLTNLYRPKPIDNEKAYEFHRAWHYSLFFTYDLFDRGKKLDLLPVILSSELESTTPDHASLVAQLIKHIEFEADLFYQGEAAARLSENLGFIEKYQSNSQFQNFLRDFFNKVYSHKNHEGQLITFSHFIKVSWLMDDTITAIKIIEKARELSENENACVRMFALLILVENEYASAYAVRALDVAMGYITDENSDYRRGAVRTLTALISKGYTPSFSPVLDFFINNVTDENFKYDAFYMLDALAWQKDNSASRSVLQVAVQERAERLQALLQNDALESWGETKTEQFLNEFAPSVLQEVGTQELLPPSEELSLSSGETSSSGTQETLTETQPSSVE
ncbi:hypothetical protein K2X40_02400 [Candidatus Babeliales bacterium]|nr:hypothetical protein [Candidatus Babeliales bacterium]